MKINISGTLLLNKSRYTVGIILGARSVVATNTSVGRDYAISCENHEQARARLFRARVISYESVYRESPGVLSAAAHLSFSGHKNTGCNP